MCFLIISSNCSLLINRNAIDFCTLTLYPATLLYAIVLCFYFADSLGLSILATMPSANRVSFMASFPICLHIVPSSCLIAWTTITNRRSNRGHTCLESFYHDWVWILSNSFSAWIGIIMIFLQEHIDWFLNFELATHI